MSETSEGARVTSCREGARAPGPCEGAPGGWRCDRPDAGAPACLRCALADAEAARAGEIPPFSQVRLAPADAPASSLSSPPRCSLMASLRLAGALTLAQARVVPGLVLPVVVVMAMAAVLAARLAPAILQDAAVSLAAGPFTPIFLGAVALTATMALARAEQDAVCLATPLGPPVVVLARLALVLGIDAAAGLVASLVLAMGDPGALPALLASWLVPLALVAGVAALVSIWATPWAGIICGLALVPLVSPATARLARLGIGEAVAGLQAALDPRGVVMLGVVLLVLTVATSRRALVAHGHGDGSLVA